MKWAVLLPYTAKHLSIKSELLENLQLFINNNIPLPHNGIDVNLYVGYDSDDDLMVNNANEVKTCLEKQFSNKLREVTVQEFVKETPVKICHIWKRLAIRAKEDLCQFLILLGDDTSVSVGGEKDTQWMWEIEKEFNELNRSMPNLPFGVGCISLIDEASPSFPTFPVLHRTHFEVFPEFLPDEFVNQDADPFLFETYRRYGLSRISSKVSIRNNRGGIQLPNKTYQPPLYDRVHVDWKNDILTHAVLQLREWINKRVQEKHVVDIIIPSFRTNIDLFRRLLVELEIPSYIEAMYLIIIDDPNISIETKEALHYFERENVGVHSNKRVRVRSNAKNVGASESRNVGIRESSADYLLFLDDDIIATPYLLQEYVIEADRHPGTDGFVGVTRLGNPSDHETGKKGCWSSFHFAVGLSGISFFWTAAKSIPVMPWGITANLFVRRPKHKLILFDTQFLKTGGGEDIDYCLQLAQYPLQPVQKAIAFHPWWHQGRRNFSRFYYWAFSDSLLQLRYPNLVFRSFPNLPEMIILVSFTILIYGQNKLSLIITCAGLLWAVDFLVESILNISKPEMIEIFSHYIFHTATSFQRICGWVTVIWILIESHLITVIADAGHLFGVWYFSLSQIHQDELNLLSATDSISVITTGSNHGKINYLSILQRFDFFCGTFPEYSIITRVKQFLKFAVFSFLIAALLSKHSHQTI